MTPTEELRTKLRKLLNEKIPSGGTEADTNFTDTELNTLLEESNNVYEAASVGWTEKASLLQGDVEKYSTGDEQYNMTTFKDKVNHALSMASHFKELSSNDVGGVMLKICPPGVL
jgi:hypothetical protein